jgi:hypothetical protein
MANSRFERTAGSHSLAAAAHHGALGPTLRRRTGTDFQPLSFAIGLVAGAVIAFLLKLQALKKLNLDLKSIGSRRGRWRRRHSDASRSRHAERQPIAAFPRAGALTELRKLAVYDYVRAIEARSRASSASGRRAPPAPARTDRAAA